MNSDFKSYNDRPNVNQFHDGMEALSLDKITPLFQLLLASYMIITLKLVNLHLLKTNLYQRSFNVIYVNSVVY
jgi:hypothetical protein